MNRAKLDILLDKLQADGFYEHFLLILKMLNGGTKLEKRVGGAASGACGQIFVPRKFIGQICDVIILPKDGEIIALQEAVREAQKKLKKQRKQLTLAREGAKEEIPETEEEAEIEEPHIDKVDIEGEDVY